MDDDEQVKRDKIAGWVKEGRKNQRTRKERNHALIHLGLAAMAMANEKEIELVDFLKRIPESKHDLIRRAVSNEIKK